MADPLVGRLSQVLFDLVLFPLGILNLLWMAPVLAIWRRVWFSIKPTRQIRGKVVVITGASSGIGKHIAYEFAKRGAKLVIAARRVELLEKVAENCRLFGSPDVVVVQADVQKESDCKAIIECAIKHFEILDILVNNAGVAHSFLSADAPDFSLDTAQEVINTTMWGQVYPTYYALPHLKATKGQLLNIISVASYIPYPRQAFYNAAKHAAIGFFDTLRAELGDAVTVTNILPGWTISEMTEGKLLDRGEAPAWDTDLRDEHVGPWPVLPTQDLARRAVQSALKRERNVIVPYWYNLFLFYRVFAPEVLDWSFKSLFFGKEKGKSSPMKKVVQMAGHEAFNYPEPGTPGHRRTPGHREDTRTQDTRTQEETTEQKEET